MSGWAGSTHELKTSNIAVSDLLYLLYFLRHFSGFLASHCIVPSNGVVNTNMQYRPVPPHLCFSFITLTSAKMLLGQLLLLLLSGDVQRPVFHLEVNPTVQSIIPLQSKPSAVITTIRPVVISTPSTQLTLTLVLDGVCHGRTVASATRLLPRAVGE